MACWRASGEYDVVRVGAMTPPPPPSPESSPIRYDLFAGGLRKLIESDPSLAVVAADVEHRRIGVVFERSRPGRGDPRRRRLGEAG